MGAIVRGFDTRPAVQEQVESLGAEFLSVTGVQGKLSSPRSLVSLRLCRLYFANSLPR